MWWVLVSCVRASVATAPFASKAVTLDGVTKTYKSKAGTVDALSDVTHAFPSSTFTAVMGPSGSGKSTLLQVAAGLDRASKGNVLIGGTQLGKLNEVELTKLRRATMGFVFQSYNLLPALTVYDNVALPLRLAGKHPSKRQVLAALEQVGLHDLYRRRPAELSGGQQQRVSIARALISKPAVVFADAPTGALHRQTSRQVLDLGAQRLHLRHMGSQIRMSPRPLQRMGLGIDQQIPDSWIHPPALVETLQVTEEACGQIPVTRPPLHHRQLCLRSGVGGRRRSGAV